MAQSTLSGLDHRNVRGIAEKERDTLQIQASGAEEFAKDVVMAYERSKRVTIDFSREIDILKDKIAVMEEKSSQLERYKEKYGRVGRELQKEIDIAQQRRIVAGEEKAQVEFERKRTRRNLLDEQEGNRIAQETLAKLEEQLAQGRNELNLKRAQFIQEEREYGNVGQDFADTQANLNSQIKQGLTEPEKLRLEKQCEGYKNQVAEEKAKMARIRENSLVLEDEIERARFDIKTLNQDISKSRLATKRTKKVVEELKSLLEKHDSDEEMYLSESESEDEVKQKKGASKKKNKKNKRHVKY